MNGIIKNRMTYLLIFLAFFGMIIWIIAGSSGSDTESEITPVQEEYTAEEKNSEEKASDESAIMTEQGYYMVRADEGTVYVYWVDNSGEHIHKETTIPFGLLSTEDQKILENGVRFDNDDELAGFLESYDS